MVKLKQKKIFTIILDYNNPRLTLQTISSLQKAIIPKGFSQNIVVVDNSPVPDGILGKFVAKNKSFKLITSLKNTGFAKGNNIGIKYGLKHQADYFLLLNNDVKVHRHFLKNLLSRLDSGADLVVPKIYFAPGYEYHKNRYQPNELGKVIWYAGAEFDWNNVYSKHLGIDQVDVGQFNLSREVEFANFCCVLIKKEVFQKIGYLNEQYFLYWEDGDFSTRAVRSGCKLVFEPRAIIWHKSSSSSGSGSKLHDYYLTRNRLVFGFKYAGLRTKFALIRESLRQLLAGRPGEKQGIIDFYLHRLGKGKII